MRHMNAVRRLVLLLGAIGACLMLLAGPALAVESSPSGDHRIPLVDTPRDRLGLVLIGVGVIGGGLALANARRQLKGERPQASGEFRWR